jgi:phospholipid-transporting ATPase
MTQATHSDKKATPSIFRSNRVRTSKYTWLTFIPVNLYNQYQKAANVYFTFISWLQTIRLISITDGQPLMLVPLLVVLAISMVKDAWEDYKRKKADRVENS